MRLARLSALSRTRKVQVTQSRASAIMSERARERLRIGAERLSRRCTALLWGAEALDHGA